VCANWRRILGTNGKMIATALKTAAKA